MSTATGGAILSWSCWWGANLGTSEVACDLCGRELHAHDPADRLAYCTTCERFVCHLCWIPGRRVCSACLQPGIPTLGYHRPAIVETFVRSSLSRRASRNRPAPAPPPQPLTSDRSAGRSAPRRSRLVLAAAALTLVLTSTTAALIVGDRVPVPALGPSGSPAAAATSREAVLGATPSPAGVDAAQEGTSRYMVTPGDTLRTIAGRLYGDPTAWERIYNANRDILDNPDELAIGTKLVIPDLGP